MGERRVYPKWMNVFAGIVMALLWSGLAIMLFSGFLPRPVTIAGSLMVMLGGVGILLGSHMTRKFIERSNPNED